MSELVQRVEDELNDNSLVLPVICLSDSHGNFRNDIASTYKANRGKRPLLYKALREWVFETYPAWSADAEGTTHCIRPRLEADDILGILGTSPRNLGNCVIYSEDKDLKQIPGLHIKDVGIVKVSEWEAKVFFYTQILTGDTVDNYPGCPGVGPVKAERLFAGNAPQTDADFWKVIVETYAKAGLTEDDAITQARLARILQYSDFDFKKREPILWTPTQTT